MLIAAEIALVVALAVAYGARALHLSKSGRPIPRSRLITTAIGLAALLAGMLLLGSPGRELLYWRTAQHLLIGDLACLLIAIGLTPSILAPLMRTPLRLLAPLTRAPIALALWIANLLVWQWPSILQATMRHDSLTLLQQVLLIATGLNMWSALLRGITGPRPQMSERARVAYVLIGRAAGIGIACVGIWSSDVYYPYFLRSDTASSTSPLADQGIAGVIVLAEMALIAIGLLLWMRSRVVRPALEPTPAPAVMQMHAEPVEAAQSTASPGALAMDAQT
jgi:cytochrome c oxidase assembly factor CtaG